MPKEHRFTQQRVTALAANPPEKQTDYYEQTTPNFGLRLNPGGSATFFVAYRLKNGAKGRVTLGRYPIISLKTARADAQRILLDVARGIDPQAHRRSAKAKALTVNDLAQQYFAEYVDAHELKSAREQKGYFTRDILPLLGSVPLSELDRRSLQSMVDQIAARGAKVAANRAFAYLRAALNWGLRKEMLEANVWSAIQTPGYRAETKREVTLKVKELRPFWDACQEQGLVGRLHQLVLLTAARPGEVRNMRWDQIDWEDGYWTIPREDSKNAQSQRVWLTPLTRRLLEDLQNDSEWVFPGKDPTKPIQEYKSGRSRINLQAGTSVTAHDLRRTAATMMTGELDVRRDIVAKTLNHTDRSVTAVYDRASYDRPKRKAWEAWCAYLTEQISQ